MRTRVVFIVTALLLSAAAPAAAQRGQQNQGDQANQAQRGQQHQPTGKPNVLVIWGDDIGTWNISHNNRGMMAYHTPNIDRIAKEGLSFTDYYGQQSCTAGRAAFIGGTAPVRTGMTKVGLPQRPSARMAAPPDTALAHLGFRCVSDLQPPQGEAGSRDPAPAP